MICLAWSVLLTAASPASSSNLPVGPFLFNPEIKASDLLTPLALLISVMTFAWTIRKDIESRRSAEADKVRGAAARTLGKLDRWKELALWFYLDVQPTFVETSGLLSERFDVGAARDRLWTALTSARVKGQERLLEEGIETAYVELASHYPGTYEAFKKTIEELKAVEDYAYGHFLRLAQDAVMSYDGRQKDYSPPLLGNDLRQCGWMASSFLSSRLIANWAAVHAFLVESIKQNDSELLKSKRRAIPIPEPSTETVTFAEYVRSLGVKAKIGKD